MEKWGLNDLKEVYKILQSRYSLPSFTELNKDFQIEKVTMIETELLLKEIRVCITNKFFSYLRFLESIINPANASMFVFAMAKTIEGKDKEKVITLYKQLSRLEVDFIDLDLEYSEQKEADAVKNYYQLWQEMKKELFSIVEVIKKNWDNKVEDNGKGYYG
jgi:3-dehydroquinate dehydratase